VWEFDLKSATVSALTTAVIAEQHRLSEEQSQKCSGPNPAPCCPKGSCAL